MGQTQPLFVSFSQKQVPFRLRPLIFYVLTLPTFQRSKAIDKFNNNRCNIIGTHYLLNAYKNSQNFTMNEKSMDGVLGALILAGMMVGANKYT